MEERIGGLLARQTTQRQALALLEVQVEQQQVSIDSLAQALGKSARDFVDSSRTLGAKIDQTLTNSQTADRQLEAHLSRNTLYWVIGILVVAFLSLLLFFLLRRRLDQTQLGMMDQLTQTREKLEAEGVKLDQKLLDLLERQMQLMKQERAATPAEAEVDHSLALKVADEIVRIEKNLSRMAADTKGLKQLQRSVNSIRDNFLANGYEMVDMLGKSFDEGMKVTATFIPDEDLESGERIITRIIRPQVNHHGKMIQAAQVEISQGT